MRGFLAGVVLLLAGMSLVAYWLVPKDVDDGRTPLVWTTDPNPQREPQVAWFNRLYPDCRLRIDPDNSDSIKVVVQSSAGMGPDIIGRIGPWNLQTYHEAGILMDLTDYGDAMGFGLETLAPSVRELVTLPVLMDDGSIRKRMFAYPCNTSQMFIF